MKTNLNQHNIGALFFYPSFLIVRFAILLSLSLPFCCTQHSCCLGRSLSFDSLAHQSLPHDRTSDKGRCCLNSVVQFLLYPPAVCIETTCYYDDDRITFRPHTFCAVKFAVDAWILDLPVHMRKQRQLIFGWRVRECGLLEHEYHGCRC